MGKLVTATGGTTHHHNHRHHNHHHHRNHHNTSRNSNASSAPTVTHAQQPPVAGVEPAGGMPMPSDSFNNGAMLVHTDNPSSGTAPRGGGSTFDELFKPSTNGHCGTNTNNNSIMNTQQQMMAAQMMAHMFAAAQQQQQQQQIGGDAGDQSSQAATAAAAAAAAATTLMATAQMAAQMAVASGGFGFLDMFSQPSFPKILPADEQSHASQPVSAPSATTASASPPDAYETNGIDHLLGNKSNGGGVRGILSGTAAALRASAPPNGHDAAAADGSGCSGGGPPQAKRPRAGSTPLMAADDAAAQLQRSAMASATNGTANGSGRTSRESGVDCLPNSAFMQPSLSQQQSPMDLMSVLQALAASSAATNAMAASSPTFAVALGNAAHQHFPFGTAPCVTGASPVGTPTDAAGSFLMAAAAMAAAGSNAGGAGAGPPTHAGSAGTATPLLPPLTLPLTPSTASMPSAGNHSNNNSCANGNSNAPSPSPQKRARTRIADDQVKILRQYFDINNSPSEEQIKEMARKAHLPEKVIKHWFRNTLFKERQRDKDSPYNFSIPPQMSIDLATYHRTGEARITPVGRGRDERSKEGDKEEEGRGGGEVQQEEESGRTSNNKGEQPTTTTVEEEKKGEEEEEGEEQMEEDGRQEKEGKNHHEEEEMDEEDKGAEQTLVVKGEEEEEETGGGKGVEEDEEEEEEQQHRRHGDEDEAVPVTEEQHQQQDEDEAKPPHTAALAASFVDPAATFLASLGGGTTAQQQQQQHMAALVPPLFPFFGIGTNGTPAATAAGGANGGGGTGGMDSFASMFSAFPFHPFGPLAAPAASSTASANGFSSPTAAQQQQFLQTTTPAGLVAAGGSSSTNNGTNPFGHLFSGQSMLMNSLMGQQQQAVHGGGTTGGIGTVSSTSMLSSQMGGKMLPCSSSSSSSASVPFSSAGTTMMPSSATGTTMGSGRRANRTRFTDFQLRTLQQFFDKQAYPKDDDLEMLSKKMGLSPRVIVVWFQNARQKARKVFEQQPHLLMQANHMTAGGTDLPADDQQQFHNNVHHHLQQQQQHHAGTFNLFNNNGTSAFATQQQLKQQRFVRTTSANVQCIRCKLVFQRYLELVQHQQRVCFAGDDQFPQQHDSSITNDSANEAAATVSSATTASFLDEQKHSVVTKTATATTANSSCNTTNATAATTASAAAAADAATATMLAMEHSTQELLRQLVAAHCQQQQQNSSNNLGGVPSEEDDADNDGDNQQQQHEQQQKDVKHETNGAEHYCPACDQHFDDRHALQEHRCHSHPAEHSTAHSEEAGGTMPKTRELVPAAAGAGGEPLDLSVSSAASLPLSRDEWMMFGAVAGSRSCGANSLSPTAFSMSEDGGGANEHQQQLQYAGAGGDASASSQVCSPMGSYCSTSAGATTTAGNTTMMTIPSSLFHTSHQHSPSGGTMSGISNYGSCGGGGGNGSGHNNNNCSSSNANSSSKRFRTHLTPMQVFIMKSLLNDYKTPSMQECDALGQKIGLHKRVVQVWFQNARAKERKSAGGSCTGSGAESSDDSAAAVSHCDLAGQRCHLCSVEFDARLSLQEHIFGKEHVERVREQGAQIRGVGSGGGTVSVTGAAAQLLTDCTSGVCDKEKQQQQQQQAGATTAKECGDAATATADASPQAVTTAQQIDAAALVAAQQFPYELMYAAAASGLSTGALPTLLYDPSLFGTPVPALKIPKGVMQQILADMGQRREHTLFTQDGLELTELSAKVDASDFADAGTVDLEVGWGCTQCGNVFQQSDQLQNHQKMVCVGADGVFRLIQTHYQCNRCIDRFGTQTEFQAHCQTDEHKFKQDNSSNASVSGGTTEVGAATE